MSEMEVQRSVDFRSAAHQVRLWSGDVLSRLDGELERVGISRPLLVSSPTIAKDPTILGLVTEALGGRTPTVFSGVVVDCPVHVLEGAAAAARTGGCDGIIALGGGSSIVTARALSMSPRVAERSGMELPLLGLPYVVIPTTPTTSMARSGSAVTSSEGRRFELFDPGATPSAVLLHGDLLAATPDCVFIDTAAATFSNACELLTTPGLSPLVHADIREAVDVAGRAISMWRFGVSGAEPRLLLAIAAFLCGRASASQLTRQATLGLALGHCIQRLGPVPHGAAMAAALITGLRVNSGLTQQGQAELLTLLQVHVEAPDVATAFSAMVRPMGLPLHLEELGYSIADILPLLPDMMTSHFVRTNLRQFDSSEELVSSIVRELRLAGSGSGDR